MGKYNLTSTMGVQEGIDYLNGSLEEMAGNFHGTTEPENSVPHQWWPDETMGLLKQRNAENTAWLIRGGLNERWGVPVDAILPFPSANASPGWLEANGAELIRTDYPLLWQFAQASGNIVIDTDWTNLQMYGTFSYGDSSTTFRIPMIFDFIAGVDPTKTIGKFYEDQMQKITGFMAGNVTVSSPTAIGAFSISTTINGIYEGATYGKGVDFTFDSSNSPNARTSATTDGQTWPRHVVLPYYIYTGEVW